MYRPVVPLLFALLTLACGSTSASSPPSQPASRSQTAARATPAPTPVSTPLPQVCLVTRDQGVGEAYVPPDLVALPRDYTLGSNIRLRAEAARAAVQLIDVAWQDGHKLLAESGYRSFQEQQTLFLQKARLIGQEQALRQVAPAGHSEHQLGLAVDMGIVRKPFSDDPSFGNEPEGRWLAQHGPRFGFVISYPAGKEAITGYSYEPWHVRYVGVELAQQVAASGQTLTEFVQQHGLGGC